MSPKRKPRPDKRKNILKVVRDHIEQGQVIDTRHSISRQGERQISYPQVLYVLKMGWHESRKDEWKENHASWNYAIRGTTADGVEVRVPVFFIEDDPDMTYVGIATVINIDK